MDTAGRIRLLETISNFLVRRNVNFGITTTSGKVDDEEWPQTSRNHCLSNYLVTDYDRVVALLKYCMFCRRKIDLKWDFNKFFGKNVKVKSVKVRF